MDEGIAALSHQLLCSYCPFDRNTVLYSAAIRL